MLTMFPLFRSNSSQDQGREHDRHLPLSHQGIERPQEGVLVVVFAKSIQTQVSISSFSIACAPALL